VKRLVAGLALLALSGFLLCHAAGAWHPSTRQFPVQGIDVSHHQGAIAWTKLPGQGVRFAWIKATEGASGRDPLFRRNWDEAARAGVRRGAYHFFTLCRSGADQASNFMATVPADPQALRPAIDLEYLGNCGARPEPARVRAELADFLARIEGHYRRRAILYLTPEFDRAYAISATFDRPLWLRSLVREPRFGARRWTLWQASNFRRLDGIAGRVDWNAAQP
jgi:lysozyme